MHKNCGCSTIDLVCDQLAAREDVFTRLDSRIKLLMALEAMVCIALSQKFAFPLAILGGCIVLCYRIRVPWRVAFSRMAAPLMMVSVLVLLQATLRGGLPIWQGEWVGVRVVVTREGVLAGAMSGAKVFGSVAVLFLLSVTTPVHQIFRAMRWMGVPRDWLEIANLMYRYLFSIFECAMDLVAAQRLRLGYCGAGRVLKSATEVMGAVVIRSVDQAMRTHEAMVLRGYRGYMPALRIAPLTRVEWSGMGMAAVSIAVLYYITEKISLI